MTRHSSSNADRQQAHAPDQVYATEPRALGVGKALRCAYAQASRFSDMRMFEPLISALDKKEPA
jgi:hypothetical protein